MIARCPHCYPAAVVGNEVCMEMVEVVAEQVG